MVLLQYVLYNVGYQSRPINSIGVHLHPRSTKQVIANIGLLIEPAQILVNHQTFTQMFNYVLDPQIGAKDWEVELDTNTHELSVYSRLEVNNQYQSLGIGSGLLLNGEELITAFAREVAKANTLPTATIYALDASETGWTTKQLDQLVKQRVYSKIAQGKYKRVVVAR